MLMTQSPTQLGARIRRCRESVETNSVDGIVKVFGALDDLDFDAEEINGDVYPVELGETHGIFFRGNDRLGLTFLAAIDHVQQFLLRVSMVIGVLLAVHHLGSLSSQTLLEPVRHGDPGESRNFQPIEELERFPFAGKSVLEIERMMRALDNLGIGIESFDLLPQFRAARSVRFGDEDMAGALQA